jgi:hypothetical protein
VNLCNRTLEERQAYRGQFSCQLGHLVDLRKRSMERAADELRAGNALGPLGEKVRTPPRLGRADGQPLVARYYRAFAN